MAWLKQNWHRVAVHGAGFGLLAMLAFYYHSDVLVNPTRYVILRSGTLGLIFLVASLACTPIRRILGWSKVVQIRRALGLYSFVFIAIHLWGYAVWENSLYFDLIWRDLGERSAMPLGMAAFVLLIPLAVTSTAGWQRRLGKRWRSLHRLIYPAAILSVWHYLWLDRDFIVEPLIYAAIVAVLLVVRLPILRWAHKYLPMSGGKQ
ncbi:MAG TPA: protein-methionine-sulfoxide reductase heme-binding subunit MsrQ [Anaerolineae bacterium]|nr:protein-methionine-sulfoxide reductase heme-binding subunit MsrQ [Anaerolineae bacterium]HMR65523.1 protein-methionine-sulfoxide reductase heme-binding subunit MsrQ [Anaerolineae bacterium]